MNKIDEVHEFWFGTIENERCSQEQSKIWYESSAAQDKQITEQFGDLFRQAKEGSLSEWQMSAKGQLSLIILLDQFSRNMFRGTAEAFATDDVALSICLTGMEQTQDKSLTLVERLFFYHPLQHSESIEIQQLSVRTHESLIQEYSGELQEYAKYALGFAKEHHDIVREFGRFPHRNVALERASTEAELNYLSSGGKRFGQ